LDDKVWKCRTIGVRMLAVYKPLRPCNVAGCRGLTQGKYCDQHKDREQQDEAERQRYYDRYKRDKQAAAFYNSSAWKRLREQALIRDNGLCQECLKEKKITPAFVVDHILPLKLFWHLRLTLNNLRSLCGSCHSKKTIEDVRRYGKE
jgi:5-methylcytosine-specific restriction protein A